MPYSIAIDGPAGAGKSTIARAVAKELGYVYIDTGAMYRAVGLYVLKKKIELSDEKKIVEALPLLDISLSYDDEGVQHVLLNGEDVSSAIRTERVSEAASVVSQYKAVREKLVALQQALAKRTSVVMDGRDIASKVLPDAETSSERASGKGRTVQYQGS